jgi:hypothetical protein
MITSPRQSGLVQHFFERLPSPTHHGQ